MCPPGSFEFGRELFVGDPKVRYVRKRVSQLFLRKRTAGPIGKSRRFLELNTNQLRDQRAIRDLIAEAADHGGNLGIKNRLGHAAEQIKEYFVVLPARVKDFDDIRVLKQLVEWREVDVGRHRIYHDRIVRSGNLHKAQNRIVGFLADEFSIDRDKGRGFLLLAECGERIRIGDRGDRHGRSWIHGMTPA